MLGQVTRELGPVDVAGSTAVKPPGSGSHTGRSDVIRSQPGLEHGRMWTATLEVVWRDDEMPQPIDRDGLQLLKRLQIDLESGPTSYTLTLVVEADDLVSACRAAFGDWRLLKDLAGLPAWEPISITSREFRL